MDLTPYYMETYPTNISPCSLNPTNISSHSFAFCTDYLSLSPIEHHQQIDNMPLLLPVGDITDQIDDNHLQELIVEPPELLSNAFVGNFDCQTANGVLVDNAEQDLQVRSDQLGLLIDNVESPRIDEIHTVAQESPVDIRGSQNFQYNQTSRHFSSPLERDFESNLPNRSGAKSKRQIKWTSELHEGFVQAVKDLGGIDRATPKAIVTKMKVDGLRIDQVKSHLQKYREKRWRLDCEEGSKPSWSQGNKRISAEKGSGSSVRDAQETDMLRMQWELQKGIHEQLLIQRQLQELQVRAEENSRHLQGLMEDMKRCLASHSISSTSLAMAGLSSGPLYSLALRATTEGTRLPCTQENVEKLSDNVVSDVDGDGSTL